MFFPHISCSRNIPTTGLIGLLSLPSLLLLSLSFFVLCVRPLCPTSTITHDSCPFGPVSLRPTNQHEATTFLPLSFCPPGPPTLLPLPPPSAKHDNPIGPSSFSNEHASHAANDLVPHDSHPQCTTANPNPQRQRQTRASPYPNAPICRAAPASLARLSSLESNQPTRPRRLIINTSPLPRKSPAAPPFPFPIPSHATAEPRLKARPALCFCGLRRLAESPFLGWHTWRFVLSSSSPPLNPMKGVAPLLFLSSQRNKSPLALPPNCPLAYYYSCLV